MALNIRNVEADALARRLAEIEGKEITQAVIIALREAIDRRSKRETASETAKRILARHGIKPHAGTSKPLPRSVYHDLDHDL
jgi:antitoxin VapB